MDTISDPQIAQFLIDYPSRQLDGSMLVATYEFDTFLEAVDFVTQLAELAEHLQHHPDILIQWRNVTLSTTTHDAGNQITSKDLELIQQIEQLF